MMTGTVYRCAATVTVNGLVKNIRINVLSSDVRHAKKMFKNYMKDELLLPRIPNLDIACSPVCMDVIFA